MARKNIRTLVAFLLLGSAAFAQSPSYTVQKFGGTTVLVPQGIIKSGPRSYSAFDPANPYRTNLDYNGQSGYQRALQSRGLRGVTGGVNFGNGVTVIINPYCVK